MIVRPLHWATKYAAASYIAGPDLQDAVRVCNKNTENGFSSTICPWDSPHDSPDYVASTYKQALNAIIEGNLDCYLSIKVPSLNYDLSHIVELVEIAREKGVRLHFDSLAPDTASSSMTLLEKITEKYRYIGYTLPSSWRRSIFDVEKIVALKVPVRIVKGQWPDPETPSLDSSENFLNLVDALAGRASHVGIATHDILLARKALSRLKANGTSCELEQLYGLPMRIDTVAKPLDIPVRVYTPYGHAYLSYALSAIRKRPIILGWLIKDFLRGMTKTFPPKDLF